MSNLNRIFLYVSGLGLVILGTLCTAFWLHTQAPDLFPFMDIGAWLAGALLELGKVVLMMAGLELIRIGRRWFASGVLLVCLVLSGISMFTTYQFLSIGAIGEKGEVATMEATSRSIERSIEGIDQQITSLDSAIDQKNATAERYREITYLEKSVGVLDGNAKYLAARGELIAERNDLLQRLGQAQSKATELKETEVIAFTTISVLIDVVGMLCLALAGGRPSPTTAPPFDASRQRISRISGEEPTEPFVGTQGSACLTGNGSLKPTPHEPIIPQEEQGTEASVEAVEESGIEPDQLKAAPSGENHVHRVQDSSDYAILSVNRPEQDTKKRPAIEEELIERALEALREGVEPKKASIRKALRIADARALIVLKELERLGHLVRTGKGWAVPGYKAA
ncbi:hypothetical protein [Halomonas heilongjiangensis]|uniref:Uncharacterized protein n=1 Tax=Halomonas heilongjiangensis TaxID=1387883 RepID=A0A2N7TU89_9GAMM|nr:hypothetical protein [Halomonas heilongjiangensis]PMR71743.1 hypothetical protein C1H66_01525 [Halomonas heilongjiangensis]PXX89975.1 hypothetical protein CR158_10350 [Halomonas heilongjiangensis]